MLLGQRRPATSAVGALWFHVERLLCGRVAVKFAVWLVRCEGKRMGSDFASLHSRECGGYSSRQPF